MTSTDIGLFALRLFMGLFFLLAAYRKTLEPAIAKVAWPELREALGLHPHWQWFIPTAQFFGGLALVLGFLTSLAGLGLFIILFGALVMDVWKPFCATHAGSSRAGWLYNLCENYHVLMLIILAVITISGGGALSVDAFL